MSLIFDIRFELFGKKMFQYTISNLVRRNIVNPNIIKTQTSTSLAKLKKLQADFQREDGKPIWLKRGITDKILYTSTIVSCYLGIFMCFSTIYDNAKPESWKQKN